MCVLVGNCGVWVVILTDSGMTWKTIPGQNCRDYLELINVERHILMGWGVRGGQVAARLYVGGGRGDKAC